jgi:hypothetical protein
MTSTGSVREADDWDAPGHAPAQAELGALPPGLSSSLHGRGIISLPGFSCLHIYIQFVVTMLRLRPETLMYILRGKGGFRVKSLH